jgi:hypothetical protein
MKALAAACGFILVAFGSLGLVREHRPASPAPAAPAGAAV